VFEFLVLLCLVGSIVTGRWELIIIFGGFYLACVFASKHEE